MNRRTQKRKVKIKTMIYEIYTPAAPSHGKAQKWVRNKNDWVVGLCENNPNYKNIRSPQIKEKYLIERECDSRYQGLKSRYGQAIERAELKIKELTNPYFNIRDYLF